MGSSQQWLTLYLLLKLLILFCLEGDEQFDLKKRGMNSAARKVNCQRDRMIRRHDKKRYAQAGDESRPPTII
jgi:hypothetical protein